MAAMRNWLVTGTGLRLALMAYGEWQDRTMAVKFTDVDYFVFNDAASFVAKGESPYQRATFRYTPLLAWALLPNIYLHVFFGKLLFVACDVLCGHLIFSLLRDSGASIPTSRRCSLLWLLNPLPAVVSSRGNAESVMAALVLYTLSLLQRRRLVSAGVLYGLAVHVKIYPVTYAPAIYLFLNCGRGAAGKRLARGDSVGRTGSGRPVWSLLRPSWSHVKFGAAAAVTLLLLTGLFYARYGWVFVYETYLYHIVRRDIRHNFSPYFYLLYLSAGAESSFLIKFLTFCPQLLLLLAIAWRLHPHLPLACFLSTFTFVMLNKVCTSQYFLWYLCLLPLLVPRLQLSWKKALFVTALWFLAQGLWLFPAYQLEMVGHNTFLCVWLAGLGFFSVNVYVVYIILTHYHFQQDPVSASPLKAE